MEDQQDFMERTRRIREALKKRAQEVENGLVGNSKDDILDESIKKNIQSSLQFYKLHPDETQNNSVTMRYLIKTYKEAPKKERQAKSTDPLCLPSIKRAYKPYFKKPSDLPLPMHKKIKGYKVNFSGIEPKVKKLNQAYSAIMIKKLKIG